MRVRLALGALSNRHFDNALFPLRTPHDEYILRYAEVLDALELDELYHNPAPRDDVHRWLDQAPAGFRFLPKLWKQAVAPHDPKDPKEPRPWDDDALDAARHALDAMAPVRDSGKCGPVVVQFPSRFKHTEAHAAWLDDLLDLEPDGTFAVEFRHPSWGTDPVRAFLAGRRTQMVWSTHAGAPQVDWVTGDVGVVRLAGDTWQERGRWTRRTDRLEDLLGLRDRLKSAPWAECFVAVLNPFEGNAVDSLPPVAGALVDAELGRRLSRRPGDPLLKDPPGGPKQTGLDGF